MAEGVTLRFLRDDIGRPLIMYVRDLNGQCPICGLEVIERFYDQADYHQLTVASFRVLCAEAPRGFDRVCEQCGESMTSDHVTSWMVTYGFPLGDGLLQGVGHLTPETEGGGETPVVQYVLSPFRSFDAQMQPAFDFEEDQSIHVSSDLDEPLVSRVLGRYLNLKAGWRRALKVALGNDAPPVQSVALAGGCFAVMASSTEALEREAERLRADLGGGQWVSIWLADEMGALLDGSPEEWLPEAWYCQIIDGRPHALAMASMEYLRRALRTALETLPAELEVIIDEEDVATIHFPIGSEGVETASLSLRHLAAEALLLGFALDDRVRLWLDEVIARFADAQSEGL